jgi:hypothetical protein
MANGRAQQAWSLVSVGSHLSDLSADESARLPKRGIVVRYVRDTFANAGVAVVDNSGVFSATAVRECKDCSFH